MSSTKDYRLILALVTVAIVWGTTYLGIKIAVESIPPWFVTGIRQSIASVFLLLILLYRKELKWIGIKNLKTQIILSSLMIVIANGMTTIAEKQITSSLTSLLTATSPIIVFIASVVFKLQKFSIKSLVGVLLGFLGVIIIFRDGLQDLLKPDYRMGVLALFIGILGWASGTVYTKMITINSENILLNLFYQFSFSAVVQLIFAFLFSESYSVENWTPESFVAVVYLGIFGSVITYFAFLYALKKVSPTQISILNYVNTIIAIFLGWLILDEKITAKFIFAAVLIISGVFITNYKKGMFRSQRK
ncbi:MAG: EamA family transporter [Cloacibacterium sp.]|nr:EamA family transporter [Cloacibacterium sp.]